LPEIVCNTSPLQYLYQIGQLDLLPQLTGQIIVSTAVTVELAEGFLARYVQAREGYFFPSVQDQDRRVLQMSIGDARASYLRDVAKDNPDAPMNRYRDREAVTIKLKSISFLEPGLAQVRYLAERDDGESLARSHWISTIAYGYEPDASIPLSVLADNPLGFAVSAYRTVPEDAADVR
jgi:type IV secretion system protein VirB8